MKEQMMVSCDDNEENARENWTNKVNDLLRQGWSVVPGTTAIGGAGAGSSHFSGYRVWAAIVLERGIESPAPKTSVLGL